MFILHRDIIPKCVRSQHKCVFLRKKLVGKITQVKNCNKTNSTLFIFIYRLQTSFGFPYFAWYDTCSKIIRCLLIISNVYTLCMSSNVFCYQLIRISLKSDALFWKFHRKWCRWTACSLPPLLISHAGWRAVWWCRACQALWNPPGFRPWTVTFNTAGIKSNAVFILRGNNKEWAALTAPCRNCPPGWLHWAPAKFPCFVIQNWCRNCYANKGKTNPTGCFILINQPHFDMMCTFLSQLH